MEIARCFGVSRFPRGAGHFLYLRKLKIRGPPSGIAETPKQGTILKMISGTWLFQGLLKQRETPQQTVPWTFSSHGLGQDRRPR
jgi:hypothetical protein